MKRQTETIDSFRGKYHFLSNYFLCQVSIAGLTFQNAEAAFHAMKVLDAEERKTFCSLKPHKAKKKGRRLKLRQDWESVKDQIMYEIVKAKFSQNEDLGQLLLETGDAELIEGNDWNDTYWGVFRGTGQNKLGKILMRVRDELRAGQAEAYY
jgi:ribA/ribD-fused uncharacterized protein